MDLEKERTAFEKWITTKYPDIKSIQWREYATGVWIPFRSNNESLVESMYMREWYMREWRAWYARAALEESEEQECPLCYRTDPHSHELD